METQIPGSEVTGKIEDDDHIAKIEFDANGDFIEVIDIEMKSGDKDWIEKFEEFCQSDRGQQILREKHDHQMEQRHHEAQMMKGGF